MICASYIICKSCLFLPVEDLTTKYHPSDSVAIPLKANTVVSPVLMSMPCSTTYMYMLLFAVRTNLYNLSDPFDTPVVD